MKDVKNDVREKYGSYYGNMKLFIQSWRKYDKNTKKAHSHLLRIKTGSIHKKRRVNG